MECPVIIPFLIALPVVAGAATGQANNTRIACSDRRLCEFLCGLSGRHLNQTLPTDIEISEKREILPLQALLTAAASDYSPQMVALNKPGITDEADWIERAQRSDAQAFESLYRMHIDKIYGLCLRMTGIVAEAEDCAQDAFIQAWNRIDRFRGDSAFATWLHRIAVNAVLGRMRKSKREQDRLQVVTDDMTSPVSVADTGELRDLSEAVDKLPEGARHVFVLYAVYGYSHNEASEMLGIAPGTSKAQLHRARRLLAQQLKKEGYEA
jgi:RNA polymerase sigma-70 factor (ECF subfamily)